MSGLYIRLTAQLAIFDASSGPLEWRWGFVPFAYSVTIYTVFPYPLFHKPLPVTLGDSQGRLWRNGWKNWGCDALSGLSRSAIQWIRGRVQVHHIFYHLESFLILLVVLQFVKGHGAVPFRGVSSLDSSLSDSFHTSLWFHSRWGTGLQTLAEVREEERTILVLPDHCEDLRSGRERGKVQESWWEMLEDLLWCHGKKQLGSGVEYMLRDSLWRHLRSGWIWERVISGERSQRM